VPVFEESWLLGRRVGAVQGHAYALSALGYVHRLAGDLSDAREHYSRCGAAHPGFLPYVRKALVTEQ